MRLLNFIGFFFLLFLLNLNADAQASYTLSGSLKDSTGGSPICQLAVHLIAGHDTLTAYTDTHGGFSFNNLTIKSITMVIESNDYERIVTNWQFEPKQGWVKLKPILLKKSSILLKEITIKEKPIPIILKIDTTEFNAASFQTYKDDLLEDLLKRLPGVKIDDDGNAFYMGKPMNKLRVNGKDFFTGNLTDFLKQLPAEIISKLQVINDYGDEANFTGIKTGVPVKMLNLVIKPGMNNGKFGNITALAGSNKQCGVIGNANYWQDSRQISIGTMLNKTEDINGNFNANSITASYRDVLKRTLTLSADYNYTNMAHNANINTFSQSIINTANLYNTTANNNYGKTANQIFKFDLRYQPNNADYVSITPVVGFTNNQTKNQLISAQTGIIMQDLNQKSELIAYSPSLSGTINFRHHFAKPGRNMTISFDATNNKNNEKNYLLDSIKYYDINNNPTKDSLLNRLINNQITDVSYAAKLTYSEPINQRTDIDFLFSANQKLTNNQLITNDINLAGKPDRIDSLSNLYMNSFTTYLLNIDYRYNAKNIRIIGGASFQSAILKSNTNSLPYNQTPTIHTYNLAPILNIFYLVSAQNTLNLNYNSSSESPRYNELNPVKNTVDVQNAIVGNPGLSPSFTHRISMEFSHADLKGGSFNLNLGANIVQNKIVTNTLLLPDTLNGLKQETHYLNVNGFYSVTGGYEYSFPILKINQVPYNLNLTGNINVNHNIYFTDNVRSSSQNVNLNQTASIFFKIRRWGVAVSSAYNQATNQTIAGSGINTSLKTVQMGLSGNYVVTPTLTINASGNKAINSGVSNGLSSNPLIINASFKQTLFKKQAGSIQLQAFDLLNQTNNLNRTVTANAVIDSRVKYITRYFKLTITMRLSQFGNEN